MILLIVALADCITPHFFQLIEFACFRKHDVDDHIHIIDQHPLQGLVTFMMIRFLVAMILYLVDNIIGNGTYLRLIAGFTDDKKIGNGLIDLLQIKRNYIHTFFFLNCGYDGFDDLRALC